jgi:hypothetical protein
MTDVIVWQLFDITKWQGSIQKRISSFAANLQQFNRGERRKLIVRRLLIAEVSSDQSSVCLTHCDEWCTRLIVRRDRHVQTGVWLATPEKRNAYHDQVSSQSGT